MSESTIVLITDYGTGDPAFTEVTLQLKSRIPGVTVLPQSTPPFSTINTGYWIYQIAMTPNLKDTFIYSNTAPRKEDKAAQKNNSGEKLMYARLKNGFEIIAVNAGYCFSFVKDEIEEFCYVNIPSEGSQFRSRDVFPEAVTKMVQKDNSFKGENVEPINIPDVPERSIASVDGYGNIKTTMRKSQSQFAPGDLLQITISSKTHLATYTDGIFGVQDGELTFAPGSTGHSDKFMELVLRGGSAYQMFDTPRVESTFTITKSSEK
jgi:S-adenosylmethionine hydrolase